MSNANTTGSSMSDLVDAVARKRNIPAKEVRPILQAALETIQETITNGGRMQLAGFGTFESRQRSERTGINPQTREKMTIPASKAVGFKPASTWNAKLNPNRGGSGQQVDNPLTRERGG